VSARGSLALAAALVILASHATWLAAHPPAERQIGGPVLGIETLVLPGATALHWKGPFGRDATMTGDGRFEVWRAPLWFGEPAQLRAEGADIGDAILVVDHAVGVGEALAAAPRQAPILYGVGFVLLFATLAIYGTVADAVVLAFALGAIRALSPAWDFDSDPARYWHSARDLAGGHFPDPLWPPGWPIVLTPAAALSADPKAGRLLGVALFALCPFLAAKVAPNRGSERTAPSPPVAAALITAVSFELVGFAPSLYAEPLFVACGLAFLATKAPVSTGLIGAVTALVRAHALVVVALVGPLRAAGRRRAFALAFLMPIALWSGVDSLAFGRPILISDSAGMNLWIGHRPGADGDWHDPGAPPPEGYTVAAMHAISADPAHAVRRCFGNVGRLWNASRSDRTLATRPLSLPLLPFAGLVGLAAVGIWQRPRRDLLVWLVATTVATAAFFVPVRYKLGLYPALLPAAGEGLSALVGWAARRSRRDSGAAARDHAPPVIEPASSRSSSGDRSLVRFATTP
jgi:hypothetical protein